MFLHIKHADYIGDYKIKVVFSNGRTGVADLTPALKGPVFEELQNKSLFSNLKVDEELETIVWPNGADIAPEYIYYLAFKDDVELEQLFRKWGYIAQQGTSPDRHSATLHGGR